MKTLTVELKGKTFKGSKAVTALTAALAKGYYLSPSYILWDGNDQPVGYVRYIQQEKGSQAKIVGQLSYLKEDKLSGDIVNSIELGFEVAGRRQRKPQIKVVEVA